MKVIKNIAEIKIIKEEETIYLTPFYLLTKMTSCHYRFYYYNRTSQSFIYINSHENRLTLEGFVFQCRNHESEQE